MRLGDSEYVKHNVVMSMLRPRIDSDGKIPRDLNKVAESHKGIKSFIKDINFYPDAWGDPGEILLCSKDLISRSYVITFGDGSRATIIDYEYQSHWTPFIKRDRMTNINDTPSDKTDFTLENKNGIKNNTFPKSLSVRGSLTNTIELSFFIIFTIIYFILRRPKNSKT